jgi:hypothetical protein
MIRRTLLVAFVSAGFAAGTATAAMAATEHFDAKMSPSSEVPSTNSKGSGSMTGTLNTNTHRLSYTVTWHGLSSPATMAHFHGPAPEGKNAGIQIPLGNNPKSPIRGHATLTPEQQQQLESGMWYVNVHNKAHPAGAIRGQIEKRS